MGRRNRRILEVGGEEEEENDRKQIPRMGEAETPPPPIMDLEKQRMVRTRGRRNVIKLK